MEPGEAVADLPFDLLQFVRNGTVEKLKVDELKQALKSVGVPVGNRKKAELVEDVYKNFKV
jgi:intein-encoded DNA endonuclease-like protein